MSLLNCTLILEKNATILCAHLLLVAAAVIVDVDVVVVDTTWSPNEWESREPIKVKKVGRLFSHRPIIYLFFLGPIMRSAKNGWAI